MTRTARMTILLFAIAVAVALGMASTGGAAPAANAICPTFTLNGQKIAGEVIGTWTCKAAKPWIVKMDGDHVKSFAGSVPLHNGPARYHCFATRATAKGRVIDGLCYEGTLAYPKSGFTW